ncbi:MAG TPA: cytochrome d ubiquinol oxidase subunit II [Gammaproteobacteria bacterium]
MEFSFDLSLAWAAIIAFGVVVYVVLDGFDLGVGILFPFARSHEDRDAMMNSIAPVWDGNETWLVLGGAGLFGAFPQAYAILLSGLYIPLMLMLFALILRGVSFEFRFKAHSSRYLWDISFTAGSMLAAFTQGIVVGAVVQGIPEQVTPFHWLTPFSLFTGLAVVCGYALQGATWLVMKTENDLQDWAYGKSNALLFALLVFVGGVSVWTPYIEPRIAERWFSLPNFYFLSQVPLLTLIVAGSLWYTLKRRRNDRLPFVFGIVLFLLAYAGLAISVWPYLVPWRLTLWEAASTESTQIFLLVGTLIILPFVIGYTAIGYRVFRGKVRSDAGYH